MRTATPLAIVVLALTGCSDLSRPSGFRVSRDGSGTESQVEVAPGNLVRVKGQDGKVVEVPRLHPPGTPSAGQPVLPGQKAERTPRPGGTGEPTANPAPSPSPTTAPTAQAAAPATTRPAAAPTTRPSAPAARPTAAPAAQP